MSDVLFHIKKVEPKTPNHMPYSSFFKGELAEMEISSFAFFLSHAMKSYIRERGRRGMNEEQEEAILLKQLNKQLNR